MKHFVLVAMMQKSTLKLKVAEKSWCAQFSVEALSDT